MAPYRAVTFGSGKELWRLPVPQTACYSRDCDGSGFFLDGRQYIGVESGWMYALDPLQTERWNGQKPQIVAQRLLLGDARAASHDGNLVLESSASVLGRRIYISSGAGHVYGMRRSDLAVEWDYFIGSDLDGTAVPTRRGKLLVPVEKQYIKGHGGVLCLDPSKPPEQGHRLVLPHRRPQGRGVEGRPHRLRAPSTTSTTATARLPALTAFNAIDGYLHVVSQDTMSGQLVKGPNLEPGLQTPVEVARLWNGGAISTPLLFGDTLIAAAYDQRVHLYHLAFTPSEEGRRGRAAERQRRRQVLAVSVTETDQFFAGGGFESTPTLWNGRVYVGCRDGWFYCLGDKP